MTDSDATASASPATKTPAHTVAIAAVLLAGAASAYVARLHWARSETSGEVSRAAHALSEQLRPTRPRSAEQIREECKKDACACAATAAARGLDADLSGEVLSLVGLIDEHCPKLSTLRGLRAEALVRNGQGDAGESEARLASPSDPYALYATALALWRSNRPEAATFARRAIENGRGNSAQLLAGLIAYGDGQLDLAEAAFRAMLAVDPNDTEGAYNLALVQQRKNQYFAAREGYLRVLSQQPTHLNARYNLSVLAHSIGADQEAKHHLEKLRKSGASAEQISKLQAILATPAESPGPSASSRGYSLLLGAGSPTPAPSASAPHRR